MQRITIQKPEIKLVGLKIRTNNEAEMNPDTAKISPCKRRYVGEDWADKIPHRQNPGTTLCVYTEYESDFRGEYSFYIGEEVSTFDTPPGGLETIIIPPQTYAKFTTVPGSMPNVLIKAWQEIWQLSPGALGGERAYKADFEVYDERARDPQNTVLDIYIGIQEGPSRR